MSFASIEKVASACLYTCYWNCHLGSKHRSLWSQPHLSGFNSINFKKHQCLQVKSQKCHSTDAKCFESKTLAIFWAKSRNFVLILKLKVDAFILIYSNRIFRIDSEYLCMEIILFLLKLGCKGLFQNFTSNQKLNLSCKWWLARQNWYVNYQLSWAKTWDLTKLNTYEQ